MARYNKRGGGRGGGRGRGQGRGNISHNPHQDLLSSFNNFTLADEARQTSRQDHSAFWTANLRSRPVPFVSGGAIEPLKELETLLQHVTLDNSPNNIVDENQPPEAEIFNSQEEVKQPEPILQKAISVPTKTSSLSDVSDIIGPEELEMSIRAEASREEVPIFTIDLSRSRSNVPTSTTPLDNTKIPDPSSPLLVTESDEDIILFKGRESRNQASTTITDDITIMAEPSSHAEAGRDINLSFNSKRTKKKRKNRTGRNKARGQPSLSNSILEDDKDDSDDAILEDYIANMRETGDMDFLVPQSKHKHHDSDDLETTDRTVKAGTNKMNSLDNHKTNDENAMDKLIHETLLHSDDSQAEEDQGESEDETLAQLLANQSLGFKLDPDFRGHSDAGFGDSSDTDTFRIPGQAQIPDEFDPMEWERPSLQRRRKGAQAMLDIRHTDPQLEKSLQMAFQNDRLKKAERKKQREELRALGQLGKAASPNNLMVKYQKGMSGEQAVEEIRSFVQGSDQTLTMPPMDKHARKCIHEVANKLKLQSKSIGKGDERRPVLYRTKRTMPYNEAWFDSIIRRLPRKFLPRPDQQGPSGKKTLGPVSRASMAAVNVAEGEIVGACAPELGVENRGRNMLEKMGWSSGTALGAEHNKGILQPVMQAMKKSKAGLG